jgi:hypothetical protein
MAAPTIAEAISRGKRILQERIHLEPSTRLCEPEKPYTVICPQTEYHEKCTHNRKSLLIDRNPLKMDQHFKIHQHKKSQIECAANKFRVYRIVHPPAKRYKKCNHHDNIIVDREQLTDTEHLDLLAQPNKVS